MIACIDVILHVHSDQAALLQSITQFAQGYNRYVHSNVYMYIQYTASSMWERESNSGYQVGDPAMGS